MKAAPIALVVLVAISLPVDAQQPDLPETRIVLRVSRKFIRCLVGREFAHTEPIESTIDGTVLNGSARVTGKFHINLIESTTESDFELGVTGEVTTQLTATRRPVVIQAHGAAPFSGKRRIMHTGDEFTADPVTIDVNHRFVLDEICPFRRGVIGAVTKRLARPAVRRSLADGDRQADDEIRAKLTQGLETELDKLVVAVNKVPPLVKQAHEIVIAENKLPKEGVRFYRAATKEHLFISVGKPDHRIPTLPALAKEMEAPLELWIAVSKKADKAERRRFLLQNWKLIVPLLTLQLERRSPELVKEIDEPLVKMLEDVIIHEVPGWHVVAFAPKIQTRVIEIP